MEEKFLNSVFPQQARVHRSGGHSGGHAIFNGLRMEVNREVDECFLLIKTLQLLRKFEEPAPQERALEHERFYRVVSSLLGALSVFVGANRLQIGVEHGIPMVH
jgi:hypothetical protein